MTHRALPDAPLSGSQVAILIVAATVLGTVTGGTLVPAFALPGDARFVVDSITTFSVGALALLAIPSFRARAATLLRSPVPRSRYVDVLLAIVVAGLGEFAVFGLEALLRWIAGGDGAVMRMQPGPTQSIDAAFAATTLRDLVITCLIAPLLEEIYYRGFLFEAWARTRPAAVALVLSSGVFMLVHPTWIHAFFGGLVLCAVYLRTGALRASILVHFCANALNWYPLLGQFLIPPDNQGIRSWTFHLVCLATAPLFAIGYAWLATRTARPLRDGETCAAPA